MDKKGEEYTLHITFTIIIIIIIIIINISTTTIIITITITKALDLERQTAGSRQQTADGTTNTSYFYRET
jgi:hypothetical protein